MGPPDFNGSSRYSFIPVAKGFKKKPTSIQNHLRLLGTKNAKEST
jgi:hypothetical protein